MISVCFDASRVYCVGSAGITIPGKKPAFSSRREMYRAQHKLERAKAMMVRQQPAADFIA
jgi:hypothetical protein